MIPGEKLVHSYDTDRHANRCGLPGQTSSTKHPAGVTCPDCRRILSAGAADAPAELDVAASSGGDAVTS
jgi:hypothetical protein